jgi:hypothetical protein
MGIELLDTMKCRHRVQRYYAAAGGILNSQSVHHRLQKAAPRIIRSRSLIMAYSKVTLS